MSAPKPFLRAQDELLRNAKWFVLRKNLSCARTFSLCAGQKYEINLSFYQKSAGYYKNQPFLYGFSAFFGIVGSYGVMS